MSAAGMQAAVFRIADDFLKAIGDIFDDDTISTNIKVGKNTLRNSALDNSLFVNISKTENPVLEAMFNDYVVYLEWDRPRKYGKRPPIAVLKDWAAKNGIPTDADTLWKISNAIWRDGHVGRPIFATMDTVLDGLFMDQWADQLFTALTADLDQLFND